MRVGGVRAVLQVAPVLFEPWRNIFPESWNCFRRIVKLSYEGNEEKYAKLALMNHVKADSPAVFHLCAENEHMFPIRYVDEFKRRMDEVGVRCECNTYENAKHGFFHNLTREILKEAFKDVLAFLERL